MTSFSINNLFTKGQRSLLKGEMNILTREQYEPYFFKDVFIYVIFKLHSYE